MTLAAPAQRRGGVVAGLVALLGMALFAIPMAFERLSPQPLLADVELLNVTSFSIVRQAYPDADLMNGLVLATGSGLALMMALLVWKGVVDAAPLRRFFVVSAVLLAVLAIEETFEVTEALAVALGVDSGQTDLLLPVLGGAFVLAYRRVLVRSRLAVKLAVAGALLFLSTLVADLILSATRHEDPLESVSSLLFVTAFAVLTLELLGHPRTSEAAA